MAIPARTGFTGHKHFPVLAQKLNTEVTRVTIRCAVHSAGLRLGTLMAIITLSPIKMTIGS